jgi:hypothetical protein
MSGTKLADKIAYHKILESAIDGKMYDDNYNDSSNQTVVIYEIKMH